MAQKGIPFLILSAFIGVCVATASMADEPMRCGAHLVTSASSVQELVRICGTPAQKESQTEDIKSKSANGTLRVVGQSTTEKWTYNVGSGKFLRVVTIVDGKIVSIETDTGRRAK